jgi:GGDEF domain-containing protein
VTCSVGVVTYAQPPRDVEELLASADALMYEARPPAVTTCGRRASRCLVGQAEALDFEELAASRGR